MVDAPATHTWMTHAAGGSTIHLMAKKRKRKRRRSAPAQRPGTERVPAKGGRPTPPNQRGGGPPPPPWGSFPLSELVIFVGVVLLIAGFFVGPPRGPVMLVAGLALASLGGLELAVREHLAGYRSHTVLLAGACGIAILVGTLALRLDPAIGAAAAVIIFGFAAWLLVGLFRRRSGGAVYRIKG